MAAALAVLAGCGSPREAYFGPFNDISLGGPGHLGVQTLLGVGDLQAHSGDSVTLVSAKPLGASQAHFTSYVLPLSESHGGIGGIEGDTFGNGLSFSAYAKPLAGFTFTASLGEIEVVLRVAADRPGDVAFTGVDLTFRVNGGPDRTQRIPTSGVVCFGNPPPSACP